MPSFCMCVISCISTVPSVDILWSIVCVTVHLEAYHVITAESMLKMYSMSCGHCTQLLDAWRYVYLYILTENPCCFGLGR